MLSFTVQTRCTTSCSVPQVKEHGPRGKQLTGDVGVNTGGTGTPPGSQSHPCQSTFLLQRLQFTFSCFTLGGSSHSSPQVQLLCNTWQRNIPHHNRGCFFPVVETTCLQADLRTRQSRCRRKAWFLTCPFLLRKIPFLSGRSTVRPHYFSRSLAKYFLIDFLY